VQTVSGAAMDIYISRLSQPSRSVLLLCSVSGVEHTLHEVDLRKGEHKTDDYLANVNPCGFVPALREGDFMLAESGAILSYICDSNELETLYPTDAKIRAKVNFWLFWNATGTRLSTMRLLRPGLGVMPADPDGKDAYTKVIQFLEDRLKELPDDHFLAGTPQVTIADLLVIPELDQLPVFGMFDYSSFPHTVAYMERVAAALGDSYTENLGFVSAVAKSLQKP